MSTKITNCALATSSWLDENILKTTTLLDITLEVELQMLLDSCLARIGSQTNTTFLGIMDLKLHHRIMAHPLIISVLTFQMALFLKPRMMAI
jgi:hypothetical protein